MWPARNPWFSASRSQSEYLEVSAALGAIYSLFKDSPARRADYTALAGSVKFPKKFCQVPWVENASAAARALEVIDYIKKYVNQAKQLPKTTT